jgi:hypothetical protein
LAAFLALGLAASAAQAEIINVDALTGAPVRVALSAGSYQISWVSPAEGGLYSGWNAWGYNTGCDAGGLGCSTGWLEGFTLSAPANFPDWGLGYAAYYYATAAQALAAVPPVQFTLASAELVTLYIGDIWYPDNQGGVSIDLIPLSVGASVSLNEPAGLGSLLLGLGCMGWQRRRRLGGS